MKISEQTQVWSRWTAQRMTVLWFAMVFVVALIPAAQADVTAGWNQDADGNWSAGANWTAGNAPTGTAGVAYFTNAITASRTVTVDASPWTIGGLTFSNSNAYGFTITNGTLNALASIVVNTNSVATIFSGITGSANLTKTGAGTLVLSGLNNYSGRTYLNAGTTVIDGSTISSSGFFDIGAVNSPAFFIFNSGAITANSQFVIGAHGTSSGVQSNGTLQVNGTFYVGGYGEGPGTGTYTQVGGTVTATSGMNFNGGGPNTGIYNLAGGSLSVSILSKNPGTGAGTFNFNGGVLKPRASSGTFMQGLTTANVQLGGALLDTAGFDITIAQPLLHEASLGATLDGGLTKLGTGILTLTGANTYTGPTLVSNGVLAVTTTNALPGYATADKVIVTSGAGLSVGVGNWSTNAITALISANAFKSNSIFGFDTTAGNYVHNNQFVLPSLAAGLLKTGPNVLTLLSGTPIYMGVTALGGILQADFGQGIPAMTNVTLTAATLSSANGSFTASLGTGMGQINLVPGYANGFSAFNVPLTVDLGYGFSLVSGTPLSWGSSTFNPSVFVLNDTGANTNLTLLNAIALNSATRTINVNTTASGTEATISGVISNGSVTAGLIKGGAGTLKLSAANTYSGGTTISAGTLKLSGGNDRLNTSGAIALNAGTLDLGGNTQAMTSGAFSMANGTTLQNGTINYKNAGWGPNASASVTFGAGGGFNNPSRLLLQDGQTLTLAANAGASSFGGDGSGNCNFLGVDKVNANTVIVNGGSLSFTNMASGAGYLRIGSTGGTAVKSTGTLSLNSGVVNMGHSMSMGTYYNNGLAAALGAATLNINGGDLFIGTGADTSSANGNRGWLYLGNDHPSTVSTSTINLNGGTLSLTQLDSGAYGTNTVNFNGGILKARTNNAAFVRGKNLTCNLGPNPAKIDTDGYTVGIYASLSGVGSLSKQGAGALILSGTNTYSGVTTVEAGSLTIASPLGDAHVKLHLDASDPSTLFTNATGVGAVTTSGQPVGYWGDVSGNNKPAKQTTLANRPTYTNNVADFNGRSALFFDGVNDDITSLLDINSTNIPNMTIMIVYKQLDKSGNAGLWGHDNGSWDRLQLFLNGSTYYQVAGNNTAYTVKGMETNKVTLYTAVLQNGVANGSYVYINGSCDSNIGLPAFTSQENSPYGRNEITFGNISAGNGFYGKLLIGEVLVFDSALGETTRRNEEARLRNKWLGTSDPTNTPVLQASGVAATLSTNTLASLKLRLDASVSSSLFTNATGVGAVTTSGQPVGYWGDRSGNNKPALQTNLVNRPTYMTNLGIFNNLPVLQFDGQNHDITSLLDINATNIPNMTIMMVFRQVTYKVNGGLWGHDDMGWDRLQLLNFGVVDANNIAGNNNSILVKGMNTNAVLLYTAVLKNGVTNGSYVYINGVSDANTGLPAFTSSEVSGLSSLTLGAIAPGSYRGNIQIGEVLVFNAALSDVARTNAEAYLRDKWTVPFPGRVSVASGAVLDLDGASQTLTGVSGAGTISNGTLTVSEPLSPAGDSIGTLKAANMAFNATLLVNVALDGSCDQLVGSGTLNLSGLTLQIANTGLLNKEKRYTLATCSGTLTGEFTATLPTNWKIRYDRTAGAATVTLVYIPPGSVIRFM